jgi:acylphosphatase
MAAPIELRRIAVRVDGRVQGVGFRYATLDAAQALGVTGWVRNTHDGAVELVAEGREQCLQELIAWCWRGPAGARVSSVATQWLASTGEFHGFRIAY